MERIANAFRCVPDPGGNGHKNTADKGHIIKIRIRTIAEITILLESSPAGPGRPVPDSAAWQQAVRNTLAADIVSSAEKLLGQPIPDLPDSLYLEYSENGNRTRYQDAYFARFARLRTLALAEGVERKGRFLPALEAVVTAICGMRTWVLPAHDGRLLNFNGTAVEIDLFSAGASFELATLDYLFQDRLSMGVRRRIHREIRNRTFDPFLAMMEPGGLKIWWLTRTNNWNAVCLAGVTGAALTLVQSPGERARFLAAMEAYIPYFLDSFTPDGYCSEGVGYWNYGFGHYVMLAEMVRAATGGKWDMMDNPHIREIARFGGRMEMVPGIYPPFADCDVHARPHPVLMGYLNDYFGLGLEAWKKEAAGYRFGAQNPLFETALFAFAAPATAGNVPNPVNPEQKLRSWFKDASVLVCRPGAGMKKPLGFAAKGGHNAENHNHNDVGSFVVAFGKTLLLVDPGNEVYTKRTFGPDRYKSDVLNSFGHPVPLPAGALQDSGKNAGAVVLKTAFSENMDTLKLDLRQAYPVPSLKKLERTLVYDRRDNGRVTVYDEFEFDSPQAFSVALVTFSRWRKEKDDEFVVTEGADSLNIRFEAQGGSLELKPREIHEDLPGNRVPVRLGLDFTRPLRQGAIRVIIMPVVSETKQ